MIARLRREFGTTVFLTAHLIEEADALFDRIGFMHRSKLVALGSPKELKEPVGAENLDQVFIHFTGGSIQTGGNYRDIQRERRRQDASDEPRMRMPRILDYSIDFVKKGLVITELEARKLKRDPSELLTRAVQPALWPPGWCSSGAGCTHGSAGDFPMNSFGNGSKNVCLVRYSFPNRRL
jgi:ABC-type multidrug transport system ATPase subunit